MNLFFSLNSRTDLNPINEPIKTVELVGRPDSAGEENFWGAREWYSTHTALQML